MTIVILLGLVAGAGLVVTTWPHRSLAAVIIVVDTAADEDVDNATCSLREAIIAANANVDYHGCPAPNAGAGDIIAFEIGSGTPTINIGATPLPPITEAVTIDGGAGRSSCTDPADQRSAGTTASPSAPTAPARSFATSWSTTPPTMAS